MLFRFRGELGSLAFEALQLAPFECERRTGAHDARCLLPSSRGRASWLTVPEPRERSRLLQCGVREATELALVVGVPNRSSGELVLGDESKGQPRDPERCKRADVVDAPSGALLKDLDRAVDGHEPPPGWI